ncbi:elongation factor G [Intestinimonas butyriciproducens]|uniref:elongation factor G n=1 Tax=Intestinimonas butyriciproducens TaxID=1297617 RepID=UPI00195DE0DA|nr:elongation factor G [Intestinimonas butyriciproducens]MBM6919239.1 elongation factor G [Intestinimonas butyriciproducens]
MAYTTEKIRNICLLGHGGDGKTSLVESLLYMTGNTDRLGKIADGTTVCDYDPEEIKRKISIQTTLVTLETQGYKLNILDTPGYFDFAGEVAQALRVAGCGLIVVSAKDGVNVGTEKAWRMVRGKKLPSFFYVSKIDEENANFDNVYENLRGQFGNSVAPFVFPFFEEGNRPAGVINIVTRKAYKAENGKIVEVQLPKEKMDKVDRLRDSLVESVATNSEEMMEKYFAGEEFTEEELIHGLHQGVLDGAITPVCCGSAFTGVGSLQLIKTLIDYAPIPYEGLAEHGVDENGEETEVQFDENGKPLAIVFKTIADQYGRFSFFKVVSGKITADMQLKNQRTGTMEKMGHIYTVNGKKNTEVKEVCCGDFAAVSKLADTKTGDTLADPSVGVTLDGIDFAEPCYSQAISPKVKGTEDKLAAGLNKLRDEDPAFTVQNNTETHQMVISGAGDIHLDVICSKLKSKFGVEVDLQDPKVPYREKIRKSVSVEGKHKKQSGGHGQYGHVKMTFEPYAEGDYLFEERTFGGSVPKNFHPAVDKGIKEAMEHGVLAGYPLVGLHAILTDGSYHDVDSNELSFKMAARLAYKAGIPQANPCILEPMGMMKVYVPDSCMGDVIGDLNKRRGRILGMNPTEGGEQEVVAEVPMAEVGSYAITLRSITQGRGWFTYKFERYEEAPPAVQQKVIEESKFVDTEE